MSKYKVLPEVIQNEFSYEMQMSRDESLAFLKRSIDDGIYSMDSLRTEVEKAMTDSELDWVGFALENKFMWDGASVSSIDVTNHLKYYLWDLLYPEKYFSQKDIKEMVNKSLDILSRFNDWMSLNDLYLVLIENVDFAELEYYNIYHLLTYSEGKIEGKQERGQGREIIYVRYKR